MAWWFVIASNSMEILLYPLLEVGPTQLQGPGLLACRSHVFSLRNHKFCMGRGGSLEEMVERLSPHASFCIPAVRETLWPLLKCRCYTLEHSATLLKCISQDFS